MLAAALIPTGCKNDQNSDNKQFIESPNGKYTVTLPKDMHTMSGINSSAQIQYANLDKGISFMVIEEDIHEYKKLIDQNIKVFSEAECFDSTKNKNIYGLAGFEFLVIDHLVNHSDNFTIESKQNKDTIINDLKARILEYKEKIKGEKSYVVLCLYESATNFYQVYAMTSQKRIVENKNDMFEMVKSLKIKTN